MSCKTLMIQGTTSHAGKSMLVTALCRIFSDMEYKVAPFKSQNMSLNSFVTEDGAEIARSQVVQALAARTKSIAEHNPILLKPKGDKSSQIVLMGKPFADYTAKEYYSEYVPKLIPYIEKSLKKLQENNDLIIIEGAGSPAEINLSDRDIANMFVAKLAKAPVILIADIDRGGVFATIYGTIKLLKPEEQSLIKYFVINKFRGEIELLESGIKQIEDLIGIKCLGVLPFIHDLKIPAEDSISLEETTDGGFIEVKVIRLPKISNFNDFEALSWEPEIHLSYISNPDELDNADLIIIPGTKNTIKDLLWMEENGFFAKLRFLQKSGQLIVGICGGYQILGTIIKDMGIEGDSIGTYKGLGLLPVQTEFSTYDKITKQIETEMIGFSEFNGETIKGYEIHMGKVSYEPEAIPLLMMKEKLEKNENSFRGAINKDKTVFGCLVHGFWDNDQFRRKFIKYIISRKGIYVEEMEHRSHKGEIDKNIQKLADYVKKNLNIDMIIKLLNL